MDRKDYEKLVKKHFEFVLKKDLKMKQVSNIMKHIATDIKENDIIGFHDIGFMKNGKSGFLITKDAFYDSSYKVKIPFKDLTNITYTKERSATVQATFHYADGSVLEDKVIIARPEEFMDILREIARQYNGETIVVRTRKKTAAAKTAVTENLITEEEAPVNVNYEELGFEYYNAGDYEMAYQYLMKAADGGNAKCMNKIGLMYYYGTYVEKAYAKALEWYKKSGEAGFPRAYGNVAYYYEYVEQNDKEGFAWYEKGALAGDAYCQYMAGVRLENGAEGVAQDYFKAYYWYTRSAEQDCARAYYYLGCMYKNGNGVPKDLNKALEYFKKGAELGDKQAKEELEIPVKVEEKRVEVTKTPAPTPEKMETAPAPTPTPKKVETALDPTGKELVKKGYNYQEGQGVPVDFKKAYECFEKAVELNYAPAYYYLAYMYKKGWHVNRSYEKACEYLVKGAELNDMRAMDELITGTAQGIYLPSKDMLKKMVEYGKTVLASDSYMQPFVERIEILANTEGPLEAFVCFTDEDLSLGVICPKCGNVLYPVPGKKLVYCTSCFSMVKSEDVKRNQPVTQKKTVEAVPEEKIKVVENSKVQEEAKKPETMKAPAKEKKIEQTLEEKLQKIYEESGTTRIHEAEVRELREALDEEADDAVFEDDYECAIKKFKVLALFEKSKYSLRIAECYYFLHQPEEVIRWADQVNVSTLDASEMSFSLAIVANVYYEENHIERAYQLAKPAADCGDVDAEELIETIEEEHGKFELPKPIETPKTVEVPKPVEAPKAVVPEKVANIEKTDASEKEKVLEDIYRRKDSAKLSDPKIREIIVQLHNEAMEAIDNNDLDTAIRKLTINAKLGFINSAYSLAAILYNKGQYKDAVRWAKSAASKGNETAKNLLKKIKDTYVETYAQRYSPDLSNGTKTLEEVMNQMNKDLEKEYWDTEIVQYLLANLCNQAQECLDAGNIESAKRKYEAAARFDVLSACWRMAEIYYNQREFKQAIIWAEKCQTPEFEKIATFRDAIQMAAIYQENEVGDK